MLPECVNKNVYNFYAHIYIYIRLHDVYYKCCYWHESHKNLSPSDFILVCFFIFVKSHFHF